MWLIDKLCFHNEIRSKEAGPHFIYLIFYGLFSVIFFFLAVDDLVGDKRQTVLDALKLAVMWDCEAQVCKRGDVPFHLDADLLSRN